MRAPRETSQRPLTSGLSPRPRRYATPTGPGRCRLFARFPFRFPPPKARTSWLGRRLPRAPNVPAAIFRRLPDWLNHMGQLKVLDDDNIFLPLQERRVADVGGWRGNYVTPTAADAYVNAYRAWFDAAGPPPHAAHAVDHFRSAPLDKAALLDRYSQHTAHCTSCLGALRAARRVAAVCRGALLALAAALPSLLGALRPLRAHVRALCGLGVLAALQALAWRAAAVVAQRLTSGMAEYPPPRNRAEGKGAARELRTVEQGRRG